MPLHSYSTTRRPPSVMDHVYAHPFELAVALAGTLTGLAAVAAGLAGEAASPALGSLPRWLLIPFGALLALGGILMALGLFDDSEDLAKGWRIERMGLVGAGFGWAAFTVILIGYTPTNVTGWAFTALLVVAMWFRYKATQAEERRTRKAIGQ